jgi:hypothetical protein
VRLYNALPTTHRNLSAHFVAPGGMTGSTGRYSPVPLALIFAAAERIAASICPWSEADSGSQGQTRG